MPIYEFKCENCEDVKEIKLTVSEPRPTTCPVCGGKLQRLWGKPDVHYQDTGFSLYKGRNGAGEAIVERKD